MLKSAAGTQLQRQRVTSSTRPVLRLRAARPVRGLGRLTPVASTAIALPSQSSNGTAQAQPLQNLAARIVSSGRELMATCAAVSLATAVFQVAAKYVNKARDAVASALPSPSNIDGVQQVWSF